MPLRFLQLVESFLEQTMNDHLLTMSEGFLKTRCAETALALGWVLQEGTSAPGMADYLRYDGKKIVAQRGPRKIQTKSLSSDLVIVDPFTLQIELKTKPDYGTKSQAQFAEMIEDFVRVAAHPGFALLHVFDSEIYRSFSGEKIETRGRKGGEASEWFTAAFPRLLEVTASNPVDVIMPINQTDLWLRFHCQPGTNRRNRIIVSGMRASVLPQSTY